MKYILALIVVLFMFTLQVIAQDDMHKEGKVEPKELSDGTLYGADITPDSKILTVTDIFTDLAGFEGKNVVVEGTMTEICRSMGCWTVISDGQNYIRAMTLHKFLMPKDMDISNKKVIVEGEFAVKEITEEQAKHFAEESGKNPDDVKGAQKMYRITAKGIKILK
jgi:hypothetical protein